MAARAAGRDAPEAQDYMTVPQAVARYEWLTLRYLRRLIAEGRLPVARVGRRVLIASGDVDELVAAGRSNV